MSSFFSLFLFVFAWENQSQMPKVDVGACVWMAVKERERARERKGTVRWRKPNMKEDRMNGWTVWTMWQCRHEREREKEHVCLYLRMFLLERVLRERKKRRKRVRKERERKRESERERKKVRKRDREREWVKEYERIMWELCLLVVDSVYARLVKEKECVHVYANANEEL